MEIFGEVLGAILEAFAEPIILGICHCCSWGWDKLTDTKKKE